MYYRGLRSQIHLSTIMRKKTKRIAEKEVRNRIVNSRRESSSKTIYAFNEAGDKIGEYKGAAAASIGTGIDAGQIKQRLKGGCPVNGIIFKFTEIDTRIF